MENQFIGMTTEDFSYHEYETIRERLIKAVNSRLTEQDKTFLLSVKNVSPNWSIYDFERFPAIQWKLRNLQKLKTNNPEKHNQQYQALKKLLHDHNKS